MCAQARSHFGTCLPKLGASFVFTSLRSRLITTEQSSYVLKRQHLANDLNLLREWPALCLPCFRGPLTSENTRMRELNLYRWMVVLCSMGFAVSGISAAQSPQPGSQMPSTPETKADGPSGKPSSDGSVASSVTQSEDARENKLGVALIKNLARDQKAIWTSPAHIRMGEATWLVPFAGLTAGFLVTDRDASLHLSNSPATLRPLHKLFKLRHSGNGRRWSWTLPFGKSDWRPAQTRSWTA